MRTYHSANPKAKSKVGIIITLTDNNNNIRKTFHILFEFFRRGGVTKKYEKIFKKLDYMKYPLLPLIFPYLTCPKLAKGWLSSAYICMC